MEKIIILLMLGLLVGCSGPKEIEPEKPSETVENEPQEEVAPEEDTDPEIVVETVPVSTEIEAQVREIFAENADFYDLPQTDKWTVEISEPMVSVWFDDGSGDVTLLRYYPESSNFVVILRVANELLIPSP